MAHNLGSGLALRLCVIGIHEGPLVLPIICNKFSLFFPYSIPMLCQITAALLLAANVAVAAPFAPAPLAARQQIGGAWNESAFTQEIQIQYASASVAVTLIDFGSPVNHATTPNKLSSVEASSR